MNKKGKAILTVFGAVLFCGQTTHATEPANIGNLTETSVKISEIDMDKDFAKAGNILDSFYTGTLTNGKSESSIVYADQSAASNPSASAEAICNAKSSKIVLSGKVPPLTNDTPKPIKNAAGNFPFSGIIGGLGLSILALRKGSRWISDEALELQSEHHASHNNSSGSGSNSNSSNNSSNSNNNSHNNTYEVEQDAATTLHCDPTGTCTQ